MKTNSSINNIKIARQTINRKLKGIDVEKLAVETGFQKRKSRKIRPIDLLISYFLICLTGKGSISLKGWAAKLSFLIGDTVSSVAIFKKIRDEQIEFLRKVLEKAIGKKAAVNERVAESLKFFNNILIQDSTCLRLNSNLETSYPGSRNQNSSTALMRINVIYDLLKGTFRHLTLSSFRNNDLMHSKDIIDYAQKGDLVLRDQGYFKMESLKQMDQKGIYFISRYKAPVKIYKDNKQIDLYRFFNNRNFIDKRFEVTSKYKYCLRIVAIKLPSEVVEQRKRKVVNKKYIHSKPYMKLLEYAIFITNVEESKLKIKQIMDIYRLRWRIEIDLPPKNWTVN